MTKLWFNLFCAAPLVLGTVSIGCNEPNAELAPVVEGPVVTTAASVVEPVGPLSSLTAVAAKPQAADGALDETAPSPAEDVEQLVPQADYQPPFPDRIDLFVPPKRQGGMVLSEGGSEDAVELLGFVRLDEPQVVLSINGQVTPITEGGSQYGIEVISIQPPKVVLQRGRQRWQASLEN